MLKSGNAKKQNCEKAKMTQTQKIKINIKISIKINLKINIKINIKIYK
jgi:hypothetical protein